MNKQTYNGYTSGRKDKKTLLKVPIQTTIDVKLLAQAYSAMKSNGTPPHSKSGILELAFNYYMQFEGCKGRQFDESEALAYLDNERLGITIDNKRHKRAVDMFVIDNPNRTLGLSYPDQNDCNRNISSKDNNYESWKQVASHMKSVGVEPVSFEEFQQNLISPKTEPQVITSSIFGSNDPKVPLSENDRLKWKQAKGIEIFPDDITPEDLDNYNNYAKDCNAKGITPASISDFLSGNIQIIM